MGKGVCVSSVMSDSATLWTVARQAPLSVGFSRQYKSGMPFPSPGHLPDIREDPCFLGLLHWQNSLPLAPLGRNGIYLGPVGISIPSGTVQQAVRNTGKEPDHGSLGEPHRCFQDSLCCFLGVANINV